MLFKNGALWSCRFIIFALPLLLQGCLSHIPYIGYIVGSGDTAEPRDGTPNVGNGAGNKDVTQKEEVSSKGNDQPQVKTSSKKPKAKKLEGLSFEFALMGDLPYFSKDNAKFDLMLDQINQDENVDWIVHVGDIKSGIASCSDEYLTNRLGVFQQSEKPFILTPGDNEWTDCHRLFAGSFKPLNRLESLRKIYYPIPSLSSGQNPMPLRSQSRLKGYEEFVENRQWQKNGILFITVHVVGSRNGMNDFKGRSVMDDEEVEKRTQAAAQWIQQAKVKIKEQNMKGLVIAMHAAPHFNQPRGSFDRQPFDPILDAIIELGSSVNIPVLITHGDFHEYVYDQPLKDWRTGKILTNVWRVQTPGESDVHWVKVRVHPTNKKVFKIIPQW